MGLVVEFSMIVVESFIYKNQIKNKSHFLEYGETTISKTLQFTGLRI